MWEPDNNPEDPIQQQEGVSAGKGAEQHTEGRLGAAVPGGVACVPMDFSVRDSRCGPCPPSVLRNFRSRPRLPELAGP